MMNYLPLAKPLKWSNYKGFFYWKAYAKLCSCANKQLVVKNLKKNNCCVMHSWQEAPANQELANI